MKKELIKVNCAILLTLTMTACSFNTDKKKSINTEKTEFQEKKTNYASDQTTKVLVDTPAINKKDIIKIVKHGDHWHVFTRDGKEHITYTDPNKSNNQQSLEFVSVVSLSQLKGKKIKEIKVHGNHWHVFTADGKEYLTYENPSRLFPKIRITQYKGSHTHKGTNRLANTVIVVKILKHGDHYHVYTSDGNEFITYTNPRSLYPHAYYGVYKGSHSASVKKNTGKSSGISGLKTIKVVSADELKKLNIVKILKHGDHYHVYTKDQAEYITYDNLGNEFMGIKIDEYKGDHKTSNNPKKKTSPIYFDKNDPKRVVKIAKHGDHWHIYRADNTEEVVYEDPSPYYPYIKVTDYEEKGLDVEKFEMFTYDEVEPAMKVDLKYLNYGGIKYTTGFDRTKQEFIVPHLDHFHNISIERIISLVKTWDTFKGHSARDVVSTLKYLVLHPEKRPYKAGWGSHANNMSAETQDSYQDTQLKIRYLMKKYRRNKSDIQKIGDTFYVYFRNHDTIEITSSDLEIKNGSVVEIGHLPKLADFNGEEAGKDDESDKNDEVSD